MKSAKGYVTDDGTFFERKEEALLWEAEAKLRDAIAEPLDKDHVVSVIRSLMPEIRSYVDAHYAAYPTIRDQQTEEQDGTGDDRGASPEDAGRLGHVSSAEEDLASLLQLPPRGSSDVPDVGGGPRSEKVSKRRQKHGP